MIANHARPVTAANNDRRATPIVMIPVERNKPKVEKRNIGNSQHVVCQNSAASHRCSAHMSRMAELIWALDEVDGRVVMMASTISVAHI